MKNDQVFDNYAGGICEVYGMFLTVTNIWNVYGMINKYSSFCLCGL